MPSPCAVCQQLSSLICGRCKLFNYCSKDHQKIHWNEVHKGNCQPLFKLETNDKLGRYLVASKNISKGQMIFQEAPLVLGPKSVSVPLCLGCHSPCHPSSFHECDGCGFPLCSSGCQTSSYHVDECRLMMRARFRAKIDLTLNKKEISYFPIVPLRCLALKEKNPDKFRRIMDLEAHLEARFDHPLYQVYKINVAEFIRGRLGADFEEKEILTIAGILDTNAFEVRTKTAKFRGLYNVASMLAHDCKPNTKHGFVFPEMTIVVTATRDIPAGEIISATYTQVFWDTTSRREHLKSAKCFDCDCRRCSDPTELGTYAGAIRCLRCVSSGTFEKPPYIVALNPLEPDTPWECQNCGHRLKSKQIRSGNEQLKQELSRTGAKTVDGLEKFLAKYGGEGEGVLHPKNFNVIQVKHALIQIIGNREGFLYSEIPDELLERKIGYCHDLLEFVDVVDPEFSRIRGEILNELQASTIIQAKRHFNQGKITKEAVQKTLSESLIILKEVTEILGIDLDDDDFQKRLSALREELEN